MRVHMQKDTGGQMWLTFTNSLSTGVTTIDLG